MKDVLEIETLGTVVPFAIVVEATVSWCYQIIYSKNDVQQKLNAV